MYEPTILIKEMENSFRLETENGICKAIKDMGIVVDKEELLKALQYDRGQYDKGYRDGIKEFIKRLEDESIESLVCLGYGEKDLQNIVEFETAERIAKKMTEANL